MSIEKKAAGYQVRWREASGRQRARSFARKVEADRFLATVVVDTARGAYIDPDAGRETVGAYAGRWAVGQPWRSSTRESRETIIERHIVPTFGTMKLQAVRTSDVQSWVGRMSGDGLAASTVEMYYRVMASVMRAARKDRLIHESPCNDVRLPRADRPASSLTVLTSDEVAALADEVPRRYRALVLVSAGLGLRQAEACAITVDRVDFLRRKVTIDRQIVTPATARGTKSGRRPPCHFGPPKTPTSNRALPLPSTVGDVLAAHLAEFGEGSDRLLFTTSTGAMLGRQTWLAAFGSAARRLGIDASPHDLRHHAASLLIASGCSPRAVASFAGHRNVAETLNTYAHLWADDEDRITAAIDAGLRRVHEMCTPAILDG